MKRFRVAVMLFSLCVPVPLRAQQETPPHVIDSEIILNEKGEMISGPGYAGYGTRKTDEGLYASEGPYPEDVVRNESPSWWESLTGTPLGRDLQNDFQGENDTTLSSPTQGSRARSTLPEGIRDGMFQKCFLGVTWIPGSHGKSFAFTQVDLGSTFAFPLFRKESRLLITPAFSAWFTEWKEDRDRFSKNLFSASSEFRLVRPLGSHYTLEFAAQPGWWSDFKSGASDGFRVPAHAGMIWNSNPRTAIVLGCAYLDRDDYDWLPFGGVVWEPEDIEMRFELLFPNPKISKRIRWWGSAVGNDRSDWCYLGGELAGGNWSFQASDSSGGGPDDASTFSYRDYRAFVGFERKAVGAMNFALELGGVFNRKFRSSDGFHREGSLDSDVFIRLKAIY